MPDLGGKVIIVTGAAGGIGQEIAGQLSTAGATVVASDVDEIALRRVGGMTRVETVVADVRKGEDWENVFASAARLGRVYALVNAVGVLKPGYIEAVSATDIDFHIDINVKGVMLGSAMAAREFRRHGSGHIVNIASLAGVAPIPGIGLYSASKFAVRGFTLALASELVGSGIYATVVCPDAVRTPMLDLQKDYPEAALTFSGPAPLTAGEVAQAVVSVIGKNETEVTLPLWRGMIAKAAGALPGLAPVLVEALRRAGLKNQEKYEKS